MNSAARRFPSITNEDAIRPHESAFRRWSSPEIASTMDGFAAQAVAPYGGVPEAASTDRADTMAAHHPPSFTVYTPDQVRSTPFRKSMPDYGEVANDTGVGARTLLKWTGIGIVAGLAVLTALIVVLNFGGDRAFGSSINARSALVGNKVTETVAATPAKVDAPVAIAKPAAKPTLELDATPPPPAKKTPTAKVASKKKR